MPENQPEYKARMFRMLGRFWTVANVISMVRLVLVFPITYLILADGPLLWLFGLILFAAVTDWFDGRVARWSNTVSEWGKVLDPLADKVAASAIVLALVVRGSLPVWFLLLIFSRDLLIVIGGIILARRTHHVAMSIFSGKLAVTALSFAVLAALLRADSPVLQVLVWATTVLMVYSFLLYLVRGIRMLRRSRVDDEDEASAHAPGAAPARDA